MKSSVFVFPGSNCDRDIAVALKKFQIENQMVWHNESNLPKSDLVILPGGFSYGDYLRTGCIASKSRIIIDVNYLNAYCCQRKILLRDNTVRYNIVKSKLRFNSVLIIL